MKIEYNKLKQTPFQGSSSEYPWIDNRTSRFAYNTVIFLFDYSGRLLEFDIEISKSISD